ncbi:MAG TPA: TetR/AcrR family transcriptional regulator [Acidimicrobiales bacterium]
MSKDESFEIRPILRQPAPELGTRARRTIDLILQATGELIMARGYGGARIDDIVQAAGVSRASFYTYFPSKRDALLMLGADASAAFDRIVDTLPARSMDPAERTDSLAAWVHEYFTFMDEYGTFIVAWSQAAHEDEELREAGMKRHLASCRRAGRVLEALRGRPFADRTQIGLLFTSMLERTWSYRHLYGDALNDADLERNAALVFVALLEAPEEVA